MPDDDKPALGEAAAAMAVVDKGRAHHDAGRLPEAETLYRQALVADPHNPDALYRLGGIALQQGRNARAVDWIAQAIALNPNIADYHMNLAIAQSALGRVNDGVAAFKCAVELAPENAEAHYNLGIGLQRIGALDEALAAFRRAVHLQPGLAAAHSSLGAALRRLGRPAEALVACQRAVDLQSGSAEMQFDLANALKATGRPEEAAAALHKAVALKPGYAEAHNNLGNLLRGLGRLDDAAAAYDRAVTLKPGFTEAQNNLGAVRHDQGRPEEAVAAIERALALKPDYAEARYNLGNALRDQGKLDDAVAAFSRAVELQPDYANAHNNLGAALQDQGKLIAAEAAYRKVLAVQPDNAEAHNNLGGTLKDQGRLEAALRCFRRAIEINPAFDAAHSNLIFALPYDPRTTALALAAEHRAWAQQHESPIIETPSFPAGDDPQRQLRIGLVSADFYSHPETFFLEPLLSHYDRSSFEIRCYANATKNDEVTARLKGYAGAWRVVAGLSDAAFVQLVRRDAIDILIELTGHLSHNRLLAFAHRPAPIQVAWLSAVNGRGMSSLDYLITDRIHAPAGADALYVEKLIRMPDGYACYRPPDYAPAVHAAPALGSGYVTFGCFNNFAKINAQVIELWAEILRNVPNARLLMKTSALDDPVIRARLIEKFEAAGISRQRVGLAGRSPHAELLTCYSQVDISLDPFPYSGGLTTCEALWQGVPVITWPGELPQGRHSASHLSNVGLSEFIANSAAEYVALAVRWARDIPALAELRTNLRERMAHSNLCDATRFTSAFEGELRRIWRDWCHAKR